MSGAAGGQPAERTGDTLRLPDEGVVGDHIHLTAMRVAPPRPIVRRPRHRYSHVDVFGVVDGRITAMRSNSLKRYRTDGNRVMAEPAVAYGLSGAAYRHSAAGRAGLDIGKSLGADRCD